MRALRLVRTAFACALVALIFTHPAHAQKPDKGGVSQVPNSDKKMAAAIKRAKQSMPFFIELIGKPDGAERFAVKIPYPTRSGTREHIWAMDVKPQPGGMVSATINNQPRDIPNLKRGQRVVVKQSRLSDWGYVKANKMHGYYTLRAILKYMPPAQAADFRQRLAPAR